MVNFLQINLEFERLELHRGGIYTLKSFKFNVQQDLHLILDADLKSLIFFGFAKKVKTTVLSNRRESALVGKGVLTATSQALNSMD